MGETRKLAAIGDGVNIAARLEGVAKPRTISLSEDAYRQVRQRLDIKVSDLGLRNSRTSPNRFTSMFGRRCVPRSSLRAVSV